MAGRIRIGKQLELSAVPGSVLVSNLTNEPSYVAHGAIGQVLTTTGPGVLGWSGGKTILTDASTVAVDAGLGRKFRLLATSGVGATRKLGNPTNLYDGYEFEFMYVQDGIGSSALTFDTKYKFTADVPSFVASTGAGKVDFLKFTYDSTLDKVFFLGVNKGG